MSVVNKMLQDLEARQAQTVEISADYQPPQKKQSKLLVLILLTLAIAAIAFALIDKNLLFSENNNSKVKTSENNQLLAVATKKMTAAPKKILPVHVPSQKTNIELIETATATELENKLLSDESMPLDENKITADKLAASDDTGTPDEPVDTQGSAELNIQTITEQTSSFSMTNASQKTHTSSLKQRIAESLNNENLDMAQSLLQQLLNAEPENIKTRKKIGLITFCTRQ